MKSSLSVLFPCVILLGKWNRLGVLQCSVKFLSGCHLSLCGGIMCNVEKNC